MGRSRGTEARSTDAELRPVVDGLERVQALAEAFAASQVVDEAGRAQPSFGPVGPARDPRTHRRGGVRRDLPRPGPEPRPRSRAQAAPCRPGRCRQRRPAPARRGAPVGEDPSPECGRGLRRRSLRRPGRDLDRAHRRGEPRAAVGGRRPARRRRGDLHRSPSCRALAAIHAVGLVHGDVKTANVLRERGGRIVLGDLGSATEAGATPITGSPATLAPEVLAGGPATPGADLYSLGVLRSSSCSRAASRSTPPAPRPAGPRCATSGLHLPPALIEVVECAADLDRAALPLRERSKRR